MMMINMKNYRNLFFEIYFYIGVIYDCNKIIIIYIKFIVVLN